MTSETLHDVFELDLPAEPAAAGMGRRFTASVLDVIGASDEASADIRLAVSEGLSALVAIRAVAPAAGVLRVRITPSDGPAFSVEDLGVSHAGDPASAHVATISDIDLARIDLIRALFPDVQVTTNDSGRLRIDWVMT